MAVGAIKLFLIIIFTVVAIILFALTNLFSDEDEDSNDMNLIILVSFIISVLIIRFF